MGLTDPGQLTQGQLALLIGHVHALHQLRQRTT